MYSNIKDKVSEVSTKEKDRKKVLPVFENAVIKSGFILQQRLCRSTAA